MFLVVLDLAEGGLLPDAGGLIAFYGGAADFFDEEAAGGQCAVADCKDGEAEARGAGDVAIFGIAFEGLGGGADFGPR